MPELRPLDLARDLDSIVAINNGGYPAVPLAEDSDIERLFALSSLALGIASDTGELVGFVMAMDPGEDYDSENYTFFESRFTNHLYIDRVVLNEATRGMGLGSVLYQAIFDKALDDGREWVTCEVNVEPPNPGSLRFHRRWGFEDVDTQATKGGAVIVQLLAARVDEARGQKR